MANRMRRPDQQLETRLLSAFAIAGLKVLLARGFGWRVVH
jgi:hypothetical protein